MKGKISLMWRVAVALVLVLSFSLVTAVPAAATSSVNNNAPAATFGVGATDQLVMDFTLTPGADAVVKQGSTSPATPGTALDMGANSEKWSDSTAGTANQYDSTEAVIISADSNLDSVDTIVFEGTIDATAFASTDFACDDNVTGADNNDYDDGEAIVYDDDSTPDATNTGVIRVGKADVTALADADNVYFDGSVSDDGEYDVGEVIWLDLGDGAGGAVNGTFDSGSPNGDLILVGSSAPTATQTLFGSSSGEQEVGYLDADHLGSYTGSRAADAETLVYFADGTNIADDADLIATTTFFDASTEATDGLAGLGNSWAIDWTDMSTLGDLCYIEDATPGYGGAEAIVREATGARDTTLESTDIVVTSGTADLLGTTAEWDVGYTDLRHTGAAALDATESIIDDVDTNEAYLDVLNAITLQNLGTAVVTTDIAAVKVWAENGTSPGFKSSEDTSLGTATWDGTDSWDLSGLLQDIAAAGQQFYVTVDVSAAPTDGTTIKMEVPALVDGNSNGAYNATDEGLFLASTDDTGNIVNANTQTIDGVVPTVQVTDPNGGEVWAGGSTHDITWTASDNMDTALTVTLEYSTNGGASWNDVDPTTVPTLPDTSVSTYSWTVPGASSDNCLVRVTATDDGGNSTSDQSDAAFTLDGNPPTVSVTAPNGGESWAGASTHNITWTASDNFDTALTLSLEYSTDGGSNWSSIITLTNTTVTTYSWIVPSVDSANCLVKVTATDDAGKSGSDQSDAVFTIAPDTTAPTVSVTAPNGSETWAGASTHNITWTASDNFDTALTIDLEYSVDGGTTWNPVDPTTVPTLPDTSVFTYSWAVPSVYSSNCLVRATATDDAGNSASDQSNAVFTIDDATPPTVAVTAPNGAETWIGGSDQYITWTASDNIDTALTIDLEYSDNAGSTWNSITTLTNNNPGTYTWTVPSINSTTCLVRITATDDAGNSTSDQSNAVFTIDVTLPTVSVTFPNGGETWAGGSSQSIIWAANDNIDTALTIDLEYSADGGTTWNSITTLTNTTATSYAWTVPSVYSADCLVRATATDDAGNSTSDQSDAVFTIDDTTAPSVAVTAPNGAETWIAGTTEDITWTASDTADAALTIALEYSSDNGASWNSITTLTNTTATTYAWTVPSVDSANCLVKVTATDDAGNSASDQSNAVFTLAPDTTAPTVTVTAPNGGETWAGASSQNITWTATDDFDTALTIDLEYSSDGGSTWNPVDPTTIPTLPNTGVSTYSWTVPNVYSDNCLVRITATDDAGNSTSDQSDAVFTIDDTTPPTGVAVTAPNGGETWIAGTTEDITWTASDTADGALTIALEYSSNNGVSWNSITTLTDTTATSYAWTVPSIDSANCLVKATVTDDAGNSASDQSDAVFTITSDTTAPTVTVTDPNGGESWAGGSSQSITWSASDDFDTALTVSLKYSSDAGSTWNSIITLTDTTATSYAWTVPSIDSANCLVKATVTDDAGNSASDQSDAVFTISTDTQAPSVTVSSPNGGESWFASESRLISWAATDNITLPGNLAIVLKYSSDGGATWETVTGFDGVNDGSHLWSVPSLNSDNCLIKVEATDAADNTGFDSSNGVFSIHVPATFAWANLSVTPTSGVAPLEITASAEVTNTGGVAGDCTAELKVDDTVVDSTTVNVAAGATEPVTFTYTLSDAGTYQVTIDELTPAVEVTVESAAVKGDFDGDGDIDLADFVEFAAAYGSSTGDPNYDAAGDFDDSGDIGLADFVEFAAVYGT